MLRVRVIPALLLKGDSLVKTTRFGRYAYVGDPCNTVRIFNELEVDELIFLDISIPREGGAPNFKLLEDIANECFMPLGYGGGVRSLDDARTIFSLGFEKVILNSEAVRRPRLISELSEIFGSQALVVSIDVKRRFLGRESVWIDGGKTCANLDPVSWSKEAESLGAGEILLTSIEQEGSWAGFDMSLVKRVSDAVNVPVIAHGGAGVIDDIASVVKLAGASAVGLGSMVVYQKKGAGVLVNFPSVALLEDCFK